MPSPHRTREIAQYEATHTTVKSVTSGTTALVAADSGKLIAADITGGNVTLTLPAAVVGLTYRAIVHKSDTGNDEFNINTAASTLQLFVTEPTGLSLVFLSPLNLQHSPNNPHRLPLLNRGREKLI